MMRILNKIIIVPYLAVIVLSFFNFAQASDITVDYLYMAISLICACAVFLMHEYAQRHNGTSGKILGFLASIIAAAIVVYALKDVILEIINVIRYSLMKIPYSSALKFDDAYVWELMLNVSYFVLPRFLLSAYKDFKNTNLVTVLGIISCVVFFLCKKELSLIQLFTVALSFYLGVFQRVYNNQDYVKLIGATAVLLTLALSGLCSNMLIPAIENINIKETINAIPSLIKNNTLRIASFIDSIFKTDLAESNEYGEGVIMAIEYVPEPEGGEDGENDTQDMEDHIETIGAKSEIGDQTSSNCSSSFCFCTGGTGGGDEGEIQPTIFTIYSTFNIDRIKAISLDKFNYDTCTFSLSKNTISSTQAGVDIDKYLLNSSNEKPEKLSVKISGEYSSAVLIPYGDLQIDGGYYPYDGLVKFADVNDYYDYSLNFNPYKYSDELQNFESSYVQLVYTNCDIYNKNKDTLNDSIGRFWEWFNEDPDHIKYFGGISDIDKMLRVNNAINQSFTIVTEDPENSSDMDFISYCLLENRTFSPKTMAAIATLLYRYEGIPSRFVIGFKIDGFENNVATVDKNDLTYWSEVFINGGWVPSDDIYLPIGEQAQELSESDLAASDLPDIMPLDQDGDEPDENPVMYVETNHPVFDRLKSASYGDYIGGAFRYEEDISDLSSYKQIASFGNVTNFFAQRFITDDYLPYYIKISKLQPSSVVYVPDGLWNIRNYTMYQDKSVRFNSSSTEELIRFNPYGSDNRYKANSSYTNYVYEKYLQVPNEIRSRLEQYLSDNGIDYTSSNKALLIEQIRKLLQTQYEYDLHPGALPQDEDYILYFLLTSKKGFCQHFASAATMLYRTCGIPARYTTGYGLTAFNSEGKTTVTADQAHAWTEVYTTNMGWQAIETTASSGDGPGFDSNQQVYEKEEQTSQPNEEGKTPEENHPEIDDMEQKNESDEDVAVLQIETEEELFRVKAYSLGDYSLQERSFVLDEDIDGLSSVEFIKGLYDPDNFFRSVFVREGNDPSPIRVINSGASNWIYVPYGLLNIEDVKAYQDKYLYYEDDDMYLEYSLEYALPDKDYIFDTTHYYENFVYEKYTDVPYDIKNKLIKLLKENDIDYQSEDKLAVLRQIEHLLKNSYQCVEESVETPEGIDPIIYFLLETKKGNYTHFASAVTLLCRVCDIPARYAVGYYLENKEGDVYTLKDSNKYAWAEVYTSNLGWAPVEVIKEGEAIDDFRFDRYEGNENPAEFFDVEARDRRNILFMIAGAIAVVGIIAMIIGEIIRNNLRKKKYLLSLGVEDRQQLDLIRNINKNYLLLKKNGYNDKESDMIMLRNRFSNKKETKEDLDYLTKRVELMKKGNKSKRK